LNFNIPEGFVSRKKKILTLN